MDIEKEYKNLLRQSVGVQIELARNLQALQENTRNLNDKFALHCATVDDISKEVKAIRSELIKILKWVVIVLITVLSVFAGIKQLPGIL